MFRYTNDLPENIEECSYYNRNYTIFAQNGYNWSMKHLDNTNLIPCQYYDYSSRESVVTEVRSICNISAIHIYYTYTLFCSY